MEMDQEKDEDVVKIAYVVKRDNTVQPIFVFTGFVLRKLKVSKNIGETFR